MIVKEFLVMPPKSQKNSSSANKELYNEEQRLGDEIGVLTARLEALKNVYLSRIESLAIHKKEEANLKMTLQQRESLLEDKRADRVDILTDFTRYYKVEEAELIKKIATLDSSLTSLQVERAKLQEELDATAVTQERRIKSKRTEIDTLSSRISDMEKEFTVMLSDIKQNSHSIS